MEQVQRLSQVQGAGGGGGGVYIRFSLSSLLFFALLCFAGPFLPFLSFPFLLFFSFFSLCLSLSYSISQLSYVSGDEG